MKCLTEIFRIFSSKSVEELVTNITGYITNKSKIVVFLFESQDNGMHRTMPYHICLIIRH